MRNHNTSINYLFLRSLYLVMTMTLVNCSQFILIHPPTLSWNTVDILLKIMVRILPI